MNIESDACNGRFTYQREAGRLDLVESRALRAAWGHLMNMSQTYSPNKPLEIIFQHKIELKTVNIHRCSKSEWKKRARRQEVSE